MGEPCEQSLWSQILLEASSSRAAPQKCVVSIWASLSARAERILYSYFWETVTRAKAALPMPLEVLASLRDAARRLLGSTTSI